MTRIDAGGDDLQAIDACMRGTTAAASDHVLDHARLSAEHRLDRAIPAIAHPAIETEAARRQVHPGPEADALHPPFDQKMNAR